MTASTPSGPAPSAAGAVVDASVWISRLLPLDPNHTPATVWVERHVRSGGTLVAPTMLALEVAAAVSRRTKNIADAHMAAAQLYALPFLRLVPLDPRLVQEATDLAADLGLRGADALYAALAWQLGIPLVSFDQEQLTQPAGLIPTIQP